jgi:hypothetical protein
MLFSTNTSLVSFNISFNLPGLVFRPPSSAFNISRYLIDAKSLRPDVLPPAHGLGSPSTS